MEVRETGDGRVAVPGRRRERRKTERVLHVGHALGDAAQPAQPPPEHAAVAPLDQGGRRVELLPPRAHEPAARRVTKPRRSQIAHEIP